MTDVNHTQALKLKIWTEERNYAVGESIILAMEVRNAGNRPIRLSEFFMAPADDPLKNNLEVHVTDDAGKHLSRVSGVLTGRLEFYPQIQSIDPGEAYRDSIQLAGTFVRKKGRKKVTQALWSLGENPELYMSEYPPMTPGDFQVQVIYRVNEKHLISLNEAERTEVWRGELVSNTIELSIT